MSKKAKLITIITSAVVAVALIVLAICLVVANNNREKTQTSIMTCSTNPSIQFVLNGNDKVMRVVALNNDGKALELNASFVGLKAEDAAELFVKLSTESGKIQVDTTGTTVTISFSGLKEDYSKLKDKAVSKVNSYFDENGIIAGAIGNVESLKESLLTLKSTASDVETKTEQELMEQYQKVADAVSKIVPNEMENFYKRYDEFYAKYLEAKKEYEDGLTYWQDLMDSLPERYTKEQCKSAIDSLAKSWTSAQELFKKNVAGLAPTAESLQQSFNTLRNDFAKLITDYKTELEKHKTEFANNKAEIKQKIADFRASLNK